MTKSKGLIVSSATVRAAFVGDSATLDPSKVTVTKGTAEVPAPTASLNGKNNDGKVRGRVHPAFVAAFLAANPGTVFGEGTDKTPGRPNKPAERTVSIPRVGKNGRRITPVTLPVSEAKALAGVPGKRGRLSSAEAEAAGVAYQKAHASA